MKIINYRIVASAVLLLAGLCNLNGQTAEKTSALPFLSINSSPRTMGMGGVSAGLSSDAFAQFGNVAAVPFSDDMVSAEVAYNMWQPSASGNNVVSAGAFWNIDDRFGVTFGLLSGINKGYDLTDVSGMPDGRFTPVDLRIGAGFSYRFVDCLSLGVALNYAQSSIAPKSDLYKSVMSTFFADIQFMYTIKGFNVSLSAGNLGMPVKSSGGIKYNLPMNGKLGAGYENDFGKHHVAAGIEAGVFFGGPLAVFGGIGAEYMFNDLVAVRGGYHLGSDKDGLPSYASVGLGFRFVGINIDAAYNIASGPMKNTLSVGLGYSF